jgi:hypothetical protein
MLVNGSWGSICKQIEYDYNMASVVCRSLGLGSQGIVKQSFPNEKLESAWMLIKRCNGNEQQIFDCERSDILRYSCTSKHVLYVICGNASCK